MDELDKAEKLLAETVQLSLSNSKLTRVCQKLSRKIKADLQFLERFKFQAKGDLVDTKSNGLSSSNVPYLSGVLRVVKESEGVQDVICDMKKYGIIVDVVSDYGKTWKKVIARNPQSLHLIWAGKGQYGNKDLVKKAERYLSSAKKHSEISPPQVTCVFCSGVTHDMAEALESKGIIVEGERLDVSQEIIDKLVGVFSDSSDESDYEYKGFGESIRTDEEQTTSVTQVRQNINEDKLHLVHKLQEMSSHEKIFLDITTMLVYISDVCNGGCDFEFREKVLAEQAAAEKVGSALGSILPMMEAKTLVTCQSAMDDYWSIVTVMGGEQEKCRAKELTQRLRVMPDIVSSRFSTLVVSGQIKQRSKVIFGTADTLKCEILTSNEGFVRAAAAQNIHISAILHQPRALSEQKRLLGVTMLQD